MDPFDSAWLKWARAVVHAHTLEADIAATDLSPDGQPFIVIRHEYQPKRHGFAAIVARVEPMPVRWNLLLGDMASNLRCSLDHIAWAIVQRGNQAAHLTETQQNAVYWPITYSPKHFRTAITKKLPGARRADLAIVRRNQPWKRGKTATRWHSHTVLDSIVQSDKHREIQGLWMLPRVTGINIKSAQDCVPGRMMKGRSEPLRVDTEIGFIHARKTGPDPKIEVQYEITGYPAFHARMPLQHWMDIAVVSVGKLLNEFAEMPDSAECLGIDPGSLGAAVDSWTETAARWAGAKGREVPTRYP